jgi:hypothetical protein
VKQVEVEDAAGKPLKITLLSDWDLVFCLPYTVLTFLGVLAYRLVMAIVPIDPVFFFFKKSGISLSACLVLLPCFIAAASWVTTAAGAFSRADFGSALIVFLLAITLLVKLIVESLYLQDPHGRLAAMSEPSPRERAAFARIKQEAAALADQCVRHRYDKAFLYLGWLRTLLLLPAFICELALPWSWLRCALLLYVFLFCVLTDFEMVEHVSSHSAHGRMLVVGKAPWWARTAEVLRRYLVWPLFST